VKPVGDQAPPVFAGQVRPAEERAAAASRSGLPSRDPGPHGDAGSQRLPGAASSEGLPVAEPVDKAPPVFPDFSPRALLEASRAKRKGRGKPVDPDLTRPLERGAVEPTVVIPSDAVRGEERHYPSEHEPDVAAKSAAADDLEKALLADPPGGRVTEETAKEGPAIVGTYRSNGTVYVMYADGSIEADTPEGLFRFGSLEELKAHIASNAEANDKRQASPA
jgi:hypothetical protein